MPTTLNQPKFTDRQTNLSRLTLAVMFACSLSIGILPQSMLSLCIVLCCAVLLFCGKLYLGFPFVILYNSVYGLVFGVSILRLYTLMILVQLAMKASAKETIKAKFLLPLSVYFLFLIMVMMPLNLRMGIFLFFDIICCLSIAVDLSRNTDLLKRFFKTYVFVCLCSFITGIVIGNTMGGGEFSYLRFNGTVEDPNYMGFFFTLAVVSIICLKLFDRKWRIVLVITLYAMMMASLSMTAIVVNLLLWLFYLVAMKKLRLSSLFIIAFVILVILALYSYGLKNPNVPILGNLCARVAEKLQNLSAGDMDGFTTNRTVAQTKHWLYYISLPIINILFGGISVHPRYIHPDLGGVAHNEYLDLLLNVGLVGAALMIGFFLTTYLTYIKRYRQDRQDHDLCIVMLKTTWILYAFTLTLFLDYRFMLIFLI